MWDRTRAEISTARKSSSVLKQKKGGPAAMCRAVMGRWEEEEFSNLESHRIPNLLELRGRKQLKHVFS